MEFPPIPTLIPHQGAMCLLDRVESFAEDRVVLSTASHGDASNPLRADGGLHALALCEYGAQAMAVHGALSARAAGTRAEPGVLVALREVRFAVDRVDDLPGRIEVEATRLLAAAGSWQYAFVVRQGARELASGRAAVMVRT